MPYPLQVGIVFVTYFLANSLSSLIAVVLPLPAFSSVISRALQISVGVFVTLSVVGQYLELQPAVEVRRYVTDRINVTENS